MRYMPSRTPAGSGSGNSGNRGEGNAQDGYPFGSTTPGYIDYRDIEANGPFFPGTTRQLYQDDPNARKLHTPGSARGQQPGSGFKPPTPVDPADYVTHDQGFRTEYKYGGDPAGRFEEAARRLTANGGDGQSLLDAYKNAPDYRTRTAIESQLKNLAGRQAFINQGGGGETWDNRFDPSNNWPVPKAPSGNYQYGPGRPGPTPPNVAQSAPSGDVRRGATPTNTSAFVDSANAPAWAQQGMPPSQNPMMEGYQGGGGAGQVSGGQGGQFGPAGGAGDYVYRGPMPGMGGGYNPGQSKSGMGQNRYAYDPSQPAPHGPSMSTGGDTGMYYNNRMEYGNSSMYGGGQMSMEGRGGGFLPPGFGGGGRQPIDPGSYNPQPFNPYGRQWGNTQPGYAPFDPGQFSMPYDQYSGMGYW